jgi:hypothetical protein
VRGGERSRAVIEHFLDEDRARRAPADRDPIARAGAIESRAERDRRTQARSGSS